MKLWKSLVVVLLFFYLGCDFFRDGNSTNASSNEMGNSHLEQIEKPSKRDLVCKTMDKSLQLLVASSDKKKAQKIEIKQNNKPLSTIHLPNTNLINNFQLLETEKTKEGFRFTIEYEDKLIYQKRFMFTCRENIFFLDTVIQNKRSKGMKPISFDSQKENEEFLHLSIPLKSFRIESFLFEPGNYNARFDSESNNKKETISCNKNDDYSLRIVEDEARRGKYLKPTQPVQNIEIVQNNKVKKILYLPTGERFQDFELIDIKEKNERISIIVNWGGAKWSYDYIFNFSCIEDNLYLVNSEAKIYHRSNTDFSLYKKYKKQFRIPLQNVEFSYIMTYVYNAE